MTKKSDKKQKAAQLMQLELYRQAYLHLEGRILSCRNQDLFKKNGKFREAIDKAACKLLTLAFSVPTVNIDGRSSLNAFLSEVRVRLSELLDDDNPPSISTS
jgi:hypothetical protein